MLVTIQGCVGKSVVVDLRPLPVEPLWQGFSMDEFAAAGVNLPQVRLQALIKRDSDHYTSLLADPLRYANDSTDSVAGCSTLPRVDHDSTFSLAITFSYC